MSEIAIIAALGDNYAIGKDNKLPWHMPADLKYFKRLTTGHPVIMGKHTFEGLPNGPLPDRKNIVLSSIADGASDKYFEATSLGDAIDLCEHEEKAFIIGGGAVFNHAIKSIDRMYHTWIHADFEADTFFPKFDKKEWKEVSREDHKADDKNPYDYSFCYYEKVKKEDRKKK